MSDVSNYSIYAFFDDIGVPFYFGITNNMKKRVSEHRREVLNGSYLPKYRKVAKLLKNGFSFLVLVLESNLTKEEAVEKEIQYISIARKYLKKVYNISSGGGGIGDFSGFRVYEKGTDRLRERCRFANSCRIHKKHSPETKEKMSKAKKGISFSKKHKENLSVSRRKRIISNETIKKMSLSSRGKINIKKYKIISPDGKIFVTEKGLSDFCRKNNLSAPNMIKVLSGKRKHHKNWRIEVYV